MKVTTKIAFSGVPIWATGEAEQDGDKWKITWDLKTDGMGRPRFTPLVDWFTQEEFDRYLMESVCTTESTEKPPLEQLLELEFKRGMDSQMDNETVHFTPEDSVNQKSLKQQLQQELENANRWKAFFNALCRIDINELPFTKEGELDLQKFGEDYEQNTKITNHCKILDFSAILFALEKERIKSSDPENSHLNLKIAQVKRLQQMVGNTT